MRLRLNLDPKKCIEFLTYTGVTHADITRHVGASFVTIQKWADGNSDIPYSKIKKLWELVDAQARRLDALICTVMDREGEA